LLNATPLVVEIVKVRPEEPTFWGKVGETVTPAGRVPDERETVAANPF
jgi:hypothetical protein